MPILNCEHYQACGWQAPGASRETALKAAGARPVGHRFESKRMHRSGRGQDHTPPNCGAHHTELLPVERRGTLLPAAEETPFSQLNSRQLTRPCNCFSHCKFRQCCSFQFCTCTSPSFCLAETFCVQFELHFHFSVFFHFSVHDTSLLSCFVNCEQHFLNF